MKKSYLMTPGPTPVPEEIRNEMAKPIIHHRTKEYQAIFKDATEALKRIFKTSNDIYTFTSSGTGAMEASIANVLSAGDEVIVVRGGKFGERFGEIAKAYGVDVISGLGADDFENDAWSVDIAVGGSQKGLMIPPGLAFSSVSPKAWKAAEASKLPKFYFNFKKYKKAYLDTDTPFTSAITLVIGLKKAVEMINKKGVDAVIARHKKLALAVREAANAIGLEIFSKSPSSAVTAVNAPS